MPQLAVRLAQLLLAAAYDVTRRTTFDSIAEVWMKEVDMYSTVDDAVKMVVGNKIDMVRVDLSQA